MKTILLAASLALLGFLPVAAAADADVCALPPVSQWQACVEHGCAIVDGPALHREACVTPIIGVGEVCTPAVSQFGACVDLPCVVVDGPAFHRVVCIPPMQ